MNWMILPLKRYADFQGRSRRMEYWMFTLGVTLAMIALVILTMMIFGFSGGGADATGLAGVVGGAGIVVFVLFYLAILVPAVAVQVRRFHDQDKSGWLVLLNFIPYIGSIIVFVFMLLEGTKGPNQYGPDPKNPEGDLQSVFR
jgi:uncharacterized membrane protein YhaH (DUF805 family)